MNGAEFNAAQERLAADLARSHSATLAEAQALIARARRDPVPTDFEFARQINRTMGIPDHLVGLPSPWYRRLWQRYVTRRR